MDEKSNNNHVIKITFKANTETLNINILSKTERQELNNNKKQNRLQNSSYRLKTRGEQTVKSVTMRGR